MVYGRLVAIQNRMGINVPQAEKYCAFTFFPDEKSNKKIKKKRFLPTSCSASFAVIPRA
jgi:hypothetical protein